MLDQIKVIPSALSRGPRVFLLLLALLLSSVWQSVASSSSALSTQTPQATDVRPLKLGAVVERELAGGQMHSYQLTIDTGHYLQVIVEQHGVDVAVAVLAPDAKTLLDVDTPNGTEGEEAVHWIANAAGNYKLTVSSLDPKAAAGRYVLKVEALRPPREQDRQRVMALQTYLEARRLYKQGTAEAWQQAASKYEEALRLFRQTGERAKEIYALTELGRIDLQLGENQKGIEVYTQLLPLVRTAQDKLTEAATLNNLGVIYLWSGDAKRGMEQFEAALPLWKALGDRVNEAVTLSYLADAYNAISEWQKALEYYQLALGLMRNAGSKPGEAAMLVGLGQVYINQSEPQLALTFYQQALPLMHESGDKRSEATTLSDTGTAYSMLGDYRKALDYLGQALQLMQEVGNKQGEAATLHNIGLAWYAQGEWQKTLDYSRQALAINHASGYRAGEAGALHQISLTFCALKDYPQALEYQAQATAIYHEIGEKSGEAGSLSSQGGSYMALGQYQQALDKLTQALTLYRATDHKYGETVALITIGSVYAGMKQYQQALSYYNQALPQARKLDDRINEADALEGIGQTYAFLEQYSQAQDHFQQALRLRRSTIDPRREAETLYHLARAEQGLGAKDAARQSMEASLAIADTLRSKFASQEMRAAYQATQQEVYESYIDLLMQLHRERPTENFHAVALQASERARARSLLELLTEARADIRRGVEPSLLAREQSLQQQLNTRAARQTELLSGKHTEAQAASLAKEVANLTTQLQEVEAQIRVASPRYTALTQPQPITTTEIQKQLLDADTVLLEYALGEKRSYLWAVTPTSITSFELPPRAEIEAAAHQVYDLLITRPTKAGFPETQFVAQAAKLSQMLLGPAISQLGHKRLLVVAPGQLTYLPFAVLPATNNQTANEYQPLIAEHEIVNLPSASVLSVIRRETAGRSVAPKAIAVLADPVFEANDPRVALASKKNSTSKTVQAAANSPSVSPASTTLSSESTNTDLARAVRSMNLASTRSGFARLAFSSEEADAILSAAPTGAAIKATGFQANRATATSSDLSQYRIVHFATHGLLNSEHPELSGLVLSLFDESGKPQDGFLRLHEIYNLQLPAELVVLSACQTGLGKEISGEGLIGLTRGFMYAGAPRVMASLWQVDDLATAELMKRFYRRMLKDNLPPAAALRTVQMEMSKEKRWAAPYFWAAFVLQGEWK